MKLNFDTWQALTQLYADYAAAVDRASGTCGPTFFTDDCLYRTAAAREP
jgi:salicylate 5-hydroxylase small subunit